MTEFEDQYLDVLHNIEAALVAVIRSHPAIVDYDVRAAVEALMREYQAVARDHAMPAIKLNPLAQHLHSAAKNICEYEIGRRPLEIVSDDDKADAITNDSPKTVAEIVACLKRIRKSIDMWTGERGRRGYCEFIDEMMLN
jgi:hypothetical protein